jgi:hypothetical protein
MQLTIIVRKTCGMRHGTIEGCFDIDDRGLTAEIGERKPATLAGQTLLSRNGVRTCSN